jgi:hypothetical protein
MLEQKIEELTAAVVALTAKLGQEAVQEKPAKTTKTKTKKAEEPAAEEQVESLETVEELTYEDVRKAGQEYLTAKGNTREGFILLLGKYKAKTAADLKKEHYADFIADLSGDAGDELL